MGIFEQILDKFTKNDKNIFVDTDKKISKFDGINLNNLVVFAPKNLSELNKVIDCIASNQPIIINISSFKKNQQQYSNYLSGAVYATHAKVYQLENQLFLITPKNSRISRLRQ